MAVWGAVLGLDKYEICLQLTQRCREGFFVARLAASPTSTHDPVIAPASISTSIICCAQHEAIWVPVQGMC